MLSRALKFLVMLILVGSVALGGLVFFQDSVRPPAPPPLKVSTPDPKAPEFAGAEASVPVRAAGIQFLLPKDTRIHRQTMRRTTEYVSLQARKGGLLFQVAFYDADNGILGDGYRQAAEGLADPRMVPVLFGQTAPLMSQSKQLAGGTLLRFDLQNDLPGRRRSLMVAIPDTGPGLGTLTIDYPVDPGTGVLLTKIAQQTSFPPQPR